LKIIRFIIKIIINLKNFSLGVNMAIIAISSELIFYCGGGKEFNFMYIIAGLGNPGKENAGTRHNAGFAVIDALADKYNIDVDTAKHKGLIGQEVQLHLK